MAFKNYCWTIGNTSFRVKQLNYKNELQLNYLDEFFSIHNNESWEGNKRLQSDYYDFLTEKQFKEGTANRKDKDARELTSGLADLGLIYRDSRKLTPIGMELLKISSDSDYSTDNIFNISADSYIYLKQLLKLQLVSEGIKIKPFVSLLYMICKLKYLTKDEFTYLLPICQNVADVKNITKKIQENRMNLNIDELLLYKMFSMDNYVNSLKNFIEAPLITQKLVENCGMNRKSIQYDRPFEKVFNDIIYLCKIKNFSINEKIIAYKNLIEGLKKVNLNQLKYWKKIFNMSKNLIYSEEFFNDLFEKDILTYSSESELREKLFKYWHLSKWKSNLADYYDLNKRYFKLSDLIKYNNSTFELSLIGKYYFENIIDDLLEEDFIEQEEYDSYFVNNIDLDKISNLLDLTEKEIIDIIHNDMGDNVFIENLEDYVLLQQNQEFISVIERQFTKEILLELLDCFKNRNDKRIEELVTDEATISTCFEYVMGIIWYFVSEKEGNLSEYFNLSLDADFMPKSHAAGGNADLIFKYCDTDMYRAHDLLLEVTLSESTGQRQMEWEPVARHIENHIISTLNTNDYVVFVAANLNERTINSFRNMKSYSFRHNDNTFRGLKIIPLDIEDIKNIIVNDLNYIALNALFNKAYRSNVDDLDWYATEIKKSLAN